MSWRPWIVGLVLAASCAGPEPTDAWSIERVTTDDDVVTEELCRDVTDLALGALADRADLRVVLEELARIGALAGATDALPTINELESTIADESLSDHERGVATHDLLVAAAGSLDDATEGACGIPVFSATYATTGFGQCHLELDIPIAAYTLAGEPGTCTATGIPDRLPCWSNDGNHLAVDCVSGVIVQVVDGEWREAGEPREVVIDRTDPDAPPPPAVIVPSNAPECAALHALFLDWPPEAGSDELHAAVEPLGPGIGGLVADYALATVDPPTLEEFESIVSALDEATAAACGVPVASALASLGNEGPDVPPCWVATGATYPAYASTDCPEEG